MSVQLDQYEPGTDPSTARHAAAYVDAPAQLNPVILATAKLEFLAREKSRGNRHG